MSIDFSLRFPPFPVDLYIIYYFRNASDEIVAFLFLIAWELIINVLSGS